MSAKAKILVTAAAGHTGSAAALHLPAMGFPVRAFVRQLDARARALSQAGAEIFVGDLYDYRHLKKSMIGVQRAYHCPPLPSTCCTARCCSPSPPRRPGSR